MLENLNMNQQQAVANAEMMNVIGNMNTAVKEVGVMLANRKFTYAQIADILAAVQNSFLNNRASSPEQWVTLLAPGMVPEE